MFDRMTATASGAPPLPEKVPPATESFQALAEGAPGLGLDLDRADLQPVFDYLRRGKHLVIPPEWKLLIPRPS